jgi:hypothetical protein
MPISGSSYRSVLITIALAFVGCSTAFSQRYLAELDSSLFVRDSVRPLLKKFENLRFTGYIQPQFQVAQRIGTKTFEGGDFSMFSKNRFMLRRARIRLDYFIPSKKNKWPKALFSFQVDATERGVIVRDMFARFYENRFHNFSMTVGLFARPFGYEVNLSSAFRESPERGRMSQTLMPAERDLGAMISFDPQDKKDKLAWLKIDAGFFNGPGLTGTTDFDSRKDFITRATFRPAHPKKFEVSGGLSFFYGGWRQQTKYVYGIEESAGSHRFTVDSNISNIGRIATRKYYGADIQMKLKHAWGETEIRGEAWTGQQPGLATTSVSPGTLPLTPVYLRHFTGGFIYFLQDIVNAKNQLVLKYDWYDPNNRVKESEIGAPGSNLAVADICYGSFGAGFIHYFNDNVKLVLFHMFVHNNATQLTDYTADVPDNVFTARLQFRF